MAISSWWALISVFGVATGLVALTSMGAIAAAQLADSGIDHHYRMFLTSFVGMAG